MKQATALQELPVRHKNAPCCATLAAPSLTQARTASLAEDAIGLFLEYRDVHGYSEERAAALAIIEVREGVDAVEEINADEREGGGLMAALSDARALDLLQRLLRAPEWDSACDYIEMVADVVRDTGRAIDHPDGRSQCVHTRSRRPELRHLLGAVPTAPWQTRCWPACLSVVGLRLTDLVRRGRCLKRVGEARQEHRQLPSIRLRPVFHRATNKVLSVPVSVFHKTVAGSRQLEVNPPTV